MIQEFAPEQFAVDDVLAWLSMSGIDSARIAPNQASISFTAPLRHMEQLLTTRYYEYEDEEDGAFRLGCEEYFLPDNIGPHVDYIIPGLTLSSPVRWSTARHAGSRPKPVLAARGHAGERDSRTCEGSQNGNLVNCSLCITPDCLRALYQLPTPVNMPSKVDFGIFQAGYSTYYQENNDQYFTRFAPYVPNGTHPKLVSINGAKAPTKNPNHASGEANLDLQIAYGLVGDAGLTL